MKNVLQILLIIATAVILMCIFKITFYGIDINGELNVDIGNQIEDWSLSEFKDSFSVNID